jgi:hypothetical protein
VSITYEAYAVLEKFIRPKECVQEDLVLPVKGRFYVVRQNQQFEEKLPIATTTALNSGMTLTYGIVCIIKLIFLNPRFFETFSKALHGLERKM